MARKTLIQVRQSSIIGLKKTSKSVGLVFKDIDKKSTEKANKFADEFIKTAKIRVAPWSARRGMGLSVYDSFTKTQYRKGKNFNITIRNIAPHASALETGVKPHWIPTTKVRPTYGKITYQDKKNITEWAERKGLTYRKGKKAGQLVRWVYVGGAGSSIQKGRSRRTFMSWTLQKMKNEKKTTAVLKDAVRESLIKFRNRQRSI